MPVETAVVILDWKLPDLTKKTLDSVKTTMNINNISVVLVEQETTDTGSEELVKDFPNYSPIFNKENVGVPKGLNQGIEKSLTWKPRYIFFLNNDIELLPGVYDKLKKCIESNPRIGIVGGRAIPYNPPNPLPIHGTVVFLNGEFHPLKIDVPSGTPDLDIDMETYSVGMACSLVRVEMIKDIGMFDEIYNPCTYEDTDFCFRARSKGWKVMVSNSAKYYHVGGATFMTKGNFTQFFDRNREIFVSRWKEML